MSKNLTPGIKEIITKKYSAKFLSLMIEFCLEMFLREEEQEN